MKERITPVTEQNIEINAKTMANAMDAQYIFKKTHLEGAIPLTLFAPHEDPIAVEVDETFNKVAKGMEVGAAIELISDGQIEVVKGIAKKKNEREV
jgi:hypothetical protein